MTEKDVQNRVEELAQEIAADKGAKYIGGLSVTGRAMHMFPHEGHMILQFPEPTEAIALTPDQALALGADLVKWARARGAE